MPELRTGYEWDQLVKCEVMDPDGWDRTGKGDGVDFFKTKITLEDFKNRAMRSTTMTGRDYDERVRLFRDIHGEAHERRSAP